MTELRYAVAPITAVEVRDPAGTHDDTYTMSGYAAVYNEKTVLLDSKFITLTEEISPRAFNSVLTSQGLSEPSGVVHFNFGHDMNRAVAATDVPAGQPGSLQLRSDQRGLYFEAKVPRDDPDGVAMAVKMRSGVLRQASFAFTIADGGAEYSARDNEEGPDEEHRIITEIGHLYDVAATTQGAYSSTISGLRSYAAALGQPSSEGGRPSQPDTGGSSVVSPEVGSGADTTPALDWPEDLDARAERRRPILLGEREGS